MDTLQRHLRTAFRKLRRSPLFTLLAIFTLALGIGANSAIFSVVNTVLLRPLPFPEAEQLVGVWHTAPGIGIDQVPHSDAIYLLHREHNRVFEDIALYQESSANLTGGERPERLTAALMTPSLLEVVQIEPALGRGFTEEEGGPGGEPVALLSHELWMRNHGGDAGVVGETLRIDGVNHTVVGVMPAEFRFPTPDTEVFLPLTIDPANLEVGSFNYNGLARLKSGVSTADASAEITALVHRLPEIYPDSPINAGMLEQAQFAGRVHLLQDDVVGDVGPVLWTLLGSVGLILLIACANVANLFLVRAEGRQQEQAVRSALGASRGQLALGFLSESFQLSLAAGAAGLGLAWGGLRLLQTHGPQDLPRLAELGIDTTVLTFTLVIALVSGFFFGLMPALRRVPDLTLSLKEGGRASTDGSLRRGARGALVVGQIALALVLLAGSGLMVRSFQELGRVNPGFRTTDLVTLQLSLPASDYTDAESRAAFYRGALEEIVALPGVESAGMITDFPLGGGDSNSAHSFEDFPVGPNEVPPILDVRYTTGSYFTTAGVRLVEGRLFEPIDSEQQRPVVLLSQDLAERLWPQESAVGKRLYRGVPETGDFEWSTVVGVVGSVHHEGLAKPTDETVYYPLTVSGEESQLPYTPGSMTLVVKAAVPATTLVTPVRSAIWNLDANLPVANVRTVEQILSTARARTAFTMTLLLIAACVALVLGAVGLYGVIAYTVSQRIREIGVRMALGASRGDVTRMVVGQGLRLAALGVAFGVAGALAVTRLLSSLLYGVSTSDPLTFGAVAALLLLVALLASYLPARRAVAVSPLEALRYE